MVWLRSVVFAQDGVALDTGLSVPNGKIRGLLAYCSGTGPVGVDGDPSGPFLGYPAPGYPNAPMANALAAAASALGVALVSFGKRGSRSDHGRWREEWATYEQNQSDFEAVLDWAIRALEGRGCAGVPVGLIGFSEGALLALGLAAQRRMQVRAFYGLAPSFRAFGELIRYQFLDWPLRRRTQTASEARVALEDIERMLQTPTFARWYESANRSRFATAAKSFPGSVCLYQGGLDSQVDPTWIEEDSRTFVQPTVLRRYPDLGHCLSEWGPNWQKRSGPLSAQFLGDFATDLEATLCQLSAPDVDR